MNPFKKIKSRFHPQEDEDDIFAEVTQETSVDDMLEEDVANAKKKRFQLPNINLPKLPFHRNHEESGEEAPIKTKAQKPKKRKQKGGITRKQKRMAFACTLAILGLGFSYLYLGDDVANIPPTDPNAPAISTESTPKEKGAAAPTPIAAGADITVNPFVYDRNLPKLASAEGSKAVPATSVPQGSLPRIPTSSSSPSYQASSMPSYEAPRPSLPAIPSGGATPPAVSTPPASIGNGAAPQKSASVQGVFTGSDGQNMAIMSDGTVVSEGDTYHDGRIAYIGGDGIKFDDGSSMEYK